MAAWDAATSAGAVLIPARLIASGDSTTSDVLAGALAAGGSDAGGADTGGTGAVATEVGGAPLR